MQGGAAVCRGRVACEGTCPRCERSRGRGGQSSPCAGGEHGWQVQVDAVSDDLGLKFLPFLRLRGLSRFV